MPIKSTDLKWYGVNSAGTIASNVILSNSLHAIFPEMTGAQNKAGSTQIRAIALKNTHATLTLTGVKIYFRSLDNAGGILDIALDTIGATTNSVVVDAANPPVSWSIPTTSAGGLSVASLAPGAAVGLWIRRRGNNSAQKKPERNTLTVVGTTPA